MRETHVNVVYGRSLQNSHPTVAQRIYPTEKPYKYHECGNILGFMRKFIQEGNYLNVIYVTKSSAEIRNLLFIRRFILERNLTNVMSVARPLLTGQTSGDIRKFI